jgi:type VI secretion system secreted protein Hcp
MAAEIFLKLTGVNGESKGQGHVGEIDVLSFSHGVSNPSSVSTGGGSGTGKCDWSSITIQKQTDTASTKLMLNCANGNHFDQGILTVREAGGTSPVEYLVYTMTQVFIDSVSVGESSGGGKPSESVSMSFAAIDMVYWSQDAKGSKDQKTEIGWDVKANAATASA